MAPVTRRDITLTPTKTRETISGKFLNRKVSRRRPRRHLPHHGDKTVNLFFWPIARLGSPWQSRREPFSKTPGSAHQLGDIELTDLTPDLTFKFRDCTSGYDPPTFNMALYKTLSGQIRTNISQIIVGGQ